MTAGPQFPRAHASSHYGDGVDPIPGTPPFSPFAPVVIDVSGLGAGTTLALEDQIAVLTGGVPEGFQITLDNAAVINSFLQIGSANYGDPLFRLLGNSLIMDTVLIGAPSDLPTRRLFTFEGQRNRLVRVAARVSFDQAFAVIESLAGSIDNHMIDCESGRDDVDLGGRVYMSGDLLVHGSLFRTSGPEAVFLLSGPGFGMAAMNFNEVGIEPNDPLYLGFITSYFGTIRNAGNVMSRIQAAGAIFDPSGAVSLRPFVEQHSPGSFTSEVQDVLVAPGGPIGLGVDTALVATSTGPTSIALPSPDTATRPVSVQDVSGDAAANNITVTTPSGTINGLPTATINVAFGSLTLRSDGTNWTFN